MELTHEERFNNALNIDQTTKSANNKSLNCAEYQKITSRLLELQEGQKKTLHDFALVKKYELVDYGTGHFLKRRGTDKRVAFIEELFGISQSAYTSTVHGGRDVMYKHLSRQFYNISASQILTFVNLCMECQLKRSRIRKSFVVKPILSKEMNSRCQVDRKSVV